MNVAFTESKLDRLLAEPIDSAMEHERSTFDEMAGPFARSLGPFGAGGLGRKTLEALRREGVEPWAFSDNRSMLHGKQIDGLPVYSPERAAETFGANSAFVITIFRPDAAEDVRMQLKALGCQRVILFYPLFWKYPEGLLPHYAYGLPHQVLEAADSVRRVWQMLADETSRDEFIAQVSWRLDPEFDALPPAADHEIYFPPDIVSLSEKEVFVDCGGFDGDTVQGFVRLTGGRFSKLLVFEPDPSNFQKLLVSISKFPPKIVKRIAAYQIVAGKSSGRVHFEAQGSPSSFISDSGKVQVPCEPLDSVLAHEEPTFIKMDVEGAELDALHGARNHIGKYRPLLAIAAYHKPDHLWRIPLFIAGVSENYRFYFRRYSRTILDDLILYAVPSEHSADAKRWGCG